ncbi:MAG: phytanoyl-CoA dioxygenase family protein [Gammaproteobacteria bacterium]|nr:phytanoyl-CoA dioxygenase family protein [Gammaproteobacteria bacterium]
MLTRLWPGGYLVPRREEASFATQELERDGATLVKRVIQGDELNVLRDEIEGVYSNFGPDYRDAKKERAWSDDFRYEMFNRSPLAQKAAAHRGILDVIEPLIGEDCHVIANTCWRNPPATGSTHGGGNWHIDAGPHIPLREDQHWPEDLPHPVFAIGVQLYLEECPMASGPTAVIRGSHKSGRPPPQDRIADVDLTWNDQTADPLVAEPGDAAFFVSDVWHRRLPPESEHPGRFFLQIHYGRRDIAQRVKTTHDLNHVDDAAMRRIESDRERLLLGLHQQGFYDG